jgi:release factor glutamine methyltransferase
VDTPEGYEADGATVPWRAFLREATERLRAAGFASPESDARRIVEQASGFEGAELVLGLSEPATVRGVTAFDAMVARRLAGEPLQYVVGRWGFRTLDLMVDRRVLIPRPETEVVAGVAIDEVARIARTAAGEEGVGRADDGDAAARAILSEPVRGAGRVLAMPGSPLVVVDLGTGSGAIGLSVAVERPDVHVVLTDASADALAVAQANLAGIGRAATRVRIAEGDWFAALPAELLGAVDVVVSNPPYVAVDDDLPAEVADWEPASALIAPDAGLAHLRIIVEGAPSWLRPGGSLVLEMAPTQTDTITALAIERGYVDVEIVDDLTGRPRIVRARTI